jgi:hypothetical protein
MQRLYTVGLVKKEDYKSRCCLTRWWRLKSSIIYKCKPLNTENIYQHLTKVATLQRHNTENSKQIFPGKKLRGSTANTYIHVSVRDL